MEKNTITRATVYLATNAPDEVYGQYLLQVFDEHGRLIAIDPENLRARLKNCEDDMKDYQDRLNATEKKLEEREREIVQLRSDKTRLVSMGYRALKYALTFVPIPFVGRKSQKSKDAVMDYKDATNALQALHDDINSRGQSQTIKNW